MRFKLIPEPFKKRRYLLLILIVIIPSIVISMIGVISTLQQRKSKEIKLREKINEELIQIRDELEGEVEDSIRLTFQHAAEKKIDFDSPNQIQKFLKEILLKNPVVQYPFLIDSKNRFIFPFSKIPISLIVDSPANRVFSKKIEIVFTKGEDFEFKDRDFFKAIQFYLKCLNMIPLKKEEPHIYNAISRCYFKLNKFSQAISYLMDIKKYFRNSLEEDKSFFYSVLRRTALTHKLLRQKNEALRTYLELYEEILNYEASTNSERYTFYKNEALDYLNLHIQDYDSERKRFTRAKEMDNLEDATKLDISLRWRYYDSDSYIEEVLGDEKGKEKFRFLKIQEFYIPNDEKTQFYKDIKTLVEWKKTNNISEFHLKNIQSSILEFPVNVAFKKFFNIFFGFNISIDFVHSVILPEIIKKLDSPGLTLFFVNKNNKIKEGVADPSYRFKLLSVQFKKYFSGCTLEFYSNQQNYFRNRIRKEVLINHSLITALIITLILGIFLFYKYISREMQLVKLKSNFVDNASHTLKTPLTRIRMLAEKIQLGWISNESKREEYFQTIISETDLMTEMINNMLDFSKIEAGKKSYDFKMGSIQAVIRNIEEHYTLYLKNLGFQFTIKIDDQLPLFLFDQEAVRLMIFNLIQNAVKYSPKKKFINLKLYQQNNNAVIEIEDRGIGIEEKDLLNIFKKFFRVKDSRVRVIEGSGLGLFLVEHAVKAHHGDIKVKSKSGEGSSFSIFLPIDKIKEL